MRQPFYSIIFLITLFLPFAGQAQQYLSEVIPERLYQQGVDLLDKKKYSAARESFKSTWIGHLRGSTLLSLSTTQLFQPFACTIPMVRRN